MWLTQTRLVLEGQNTVTEEDDVVQPYVVGGFQKNVRLWSNQTPLYTLVALNRQCEEVALSYLQNGEVKPLLFKKINDVLAFRRYFISRLGDNPQSNKPVTLNKHKFGFAVPSDISGTWTVSGTWTGSGDTIYLTDISSIRFADDDFPLDLDHHD